VTIFVEPNNAGKSLLLREIQGISPQRVPLRGKILKDYEVTWPTEAEVRAEIAKSEPLKPEEDLLLDVRMGVVVGRAVRDNRGQEQDENRLGWENLPTSDTVTPGLKPGKH